MNHSQKTAVKAHRWERDPDNFYTEEPWCSLRLFDEEPFEGTIVDPCSGTRNIPNAAEAHGYNAIAYDLRDRGVPNVEPYRNFFMQWDPGYWPVDNIVSNPPYGAIPKKFQRATGFTRMEDYFIHLALRRTRRKVAVFLPAGWINSAARGKWMETLPLAKVYKCGPRPSCPPGRLVMQGMVPGQGKVDFSWYVFDHTHKGPYTGHWLHRDG